MTIRLTKALRAEIAEAIYKASELPKKYDEMRAKAREAAVQYIKDSWPEGFEAALKTIDKTWVGSISHVFVGYNFREDEVGDLKGRSITLDDPIPYPALGEVTFTVPFQQWIGENYRPMYIALQKEQTKFYETVNPLLASYRTVDALLKAVPEFQQFVPQTSATYPVPAVPVHNALTELMRLGVAFKQDKTA